MVFRTVIERDSKKRALIKSNKEEKVRYRDNLPRLKKKLHIRKGVDLSIGAFKFYHVLCIIE